MPKQTFFNLPEKKRQSIEQAALGEFSSHGFDRSNMNRIVEHSGIAKGSYYQYFEDKKDIYFHLVDQLFRKKMQAMEKNTEIEKAVIDKWAKLFNTFNKE